MHDRIANQQSHIHTVSLSLTRFTLFLEFFYDLILLQQCNVPIPAVMIIIESFNAQQSIIRFIGKALFTLYSLIFFSIYLISLKGPFEINNKLFIPF